MATPARIKPDPDDEGSAQDDDFISESGHDEDGNLRFETNAQLPEASVNKRPLRKLMDALRDGSIDLNPEYQRNVVWPLNRMTNLINSIMENFYIPPVIFNTKEVTCRNRPAAGPYTRICVDGKQRLSSVKYFIEGKISCNDKRGNKWYFCDPSGNPDPADTTKSRRLILPKEIRDDFLDNKTFIAWEFFGLTPEQEEDLFARVQMGIPLTLAEKMKASTGPWQDFANMFERDFPTVIGLLEKKSTKRGAEFRIILSCFSQIVESMYPSNPDGKPTFKSTATSLSRFLKNRRALDDATKSHLAWVFTKLTDLIELDPQTFRNNEYTRVTTFSPLELVGVTVLVSQHGESRNDQMLLGDIRAMRLSLRHTFSDLRLNSQAWNAVWKFIDDLEAFRGVADHESSTYVALPSPPAAAAPPIHKQIPHTQAKASRAKAAKPPASRNTLRVASKAEPPPTREHQSEVMPFPSILAPTRLPLLSDRMLISNATTNQAPRNSPDIIVIDDDDEAHSYVASPKLLGGNHMSACRSPFTQSHPILKRAQNTQIPRLDDTSDDFHSGQRTDIIYFAPPKASIAPTAPMVMQAPIASIAPLASTMRAAYAASKPQPLEQTLEPNAPTMTLEDQLQASLNARRPSSTIDTSLQSPQKSHHERPRLNGNFYDEIEDPEAARQDLLSTFRSAKSQIKGHRGGNDASSSMPHRSNKRRAEALDESNTKSGMR